MKQLLMAPKYTWVDIDHHDCTPRQAFDGEPLPMLSAECDALGVESNPSEWFKRFDAPESVPRPLQAVQVSSAEQHAYACDPCNIAQDSTCHTAFRPSGGPSASVLCIGGVIEGISASTESRSERTLRCTGTR